MHWGGCACTATSVWVRVRVRLRVHVHVRPCGLCWNLSLVLDFLFVRSYLVVNRAAVGAFRLTRTVGELRGASDAPRVQPEGRLPRPRPRPPDYTLHGGTPQMKGSGAEVTRGGGGSVRQNAPRDPQERRESQRVGEE